MTEWWFHPSILFIAGAFLIPFLKGKVQKTYLILVPAVAFVLVATVSTGTYGVFNFLGHEVIFGKVDRLSLVFSYVFTIMAFIGMIYSVHVEDAGQHMAAWFYVGSSIGVIFAGDYFSLFVFWEIMAFASAYLVFARKEKKSIDAGFRYILVHIFGGVCLLAGIILHYADTGSLLFGQIEQNGSIGFYLILVGFIINAAVPPLHAWLPDAYPEATITGAVFMSAFTTKTAVYVLLRAYPGTELLVILGTIMTIYGVSFATLQNDFRRLLAYHIVSQVGYMVTGIGLGTELALNGAVAHAFTHILYKGLLFMGAGAVIQMTGKRKLSELGGLHKTMPITMILYLIAGFSISAWPLFSGFVSKSMIVAAANHHHMPVVALLLTMVSAGTFLSTTLKIPYFMFFGKDAKIEAKEPPLNMLIGMGIAAFLCIVIGIIPGLLYRVLPFHVEFEPYTGDHVTTSLGILMFTALGFQIVLKKLTPHNVMSLDTDWSYREGSKIFMWIANRPIGIYEGFITEVSNTIVLPLLSLFAAIAIWIDVNIVDWIVNRVAGLVIIISAATLWIDINIIDKVVNGVADFVIIISGTIRRIQTGFLQHYALSMVVGIMVIIIIYSLMRGG